MMGDALITDLMVQGTVQGLRAAEAKAPPRLGELLASGYYGEAATMLQSVEKPPKPGTPEEEPVLAMILEAIRQMCLVGDDYKSEAELHRQAYQAATAREQQLRQHLQMLMCLIGSRLMMPGAGLDGGLDGGSADGPRQRSEIPAMLKRLQGLLGVQEVAPIERPSIEAPAPATAAALLDPATGPGQGIAEGGRPTLAVYFLGSLRVYDNGRLVEEWMGNKCKSLFKYLVLHGERPVHRDVLGDMLWPEEPETARRNLYQAVYMLRQVLQDSHPDFPYILCENSCYLFNPGLELWVDYEEFLKHYQTGQRLERERRMAEAIQQYEAAENLYEGDLLAEDLYEEWSLMLRDRLKQAYLDLLDRISRYYWNEEQYSLCVAYCQKILLADRCREDAHCRLMMAYMRQGHRHLALRQYDRCVEALQQELDTTPMPATVELYENIKKRLS